MTADDLEFIIVVVAAFVIIGAVIETWKLLAHHHEVKRSRFLEETRQHRETRQQ